MNTRISLLLAVAAEISRLPGQIETTRRALPPALVPVREAAQALGVSEITVRRRIREGSIPTVRIGRSVRVDLAALRAPEAAEVARLAHRAMPSLEVYKLKRLGYERRQ